jgi:hypothetical protein
MMSFDELCDGVICSIRQNQVAFLDKKMHNTHMLIMPRDTDAQDTEKKGIGGSRDTGVREGRELW